MAGRQAGRQAGSLHLPTHTGSECAMSCVQGSTYAYLHIDCVAIIIIIIIIIIITHYTRTCLHAHWASTVNSFSGKVAAATHSNGFQRQLAADTICIESNDDDSRKKL